MLNEWRGPPGIGVVQPELLGLALHYGLQLVEDFDVLLLYLGQPDAKGRGLSLIKAY